MHSTSQILKLSGCHCYVAPLKLLYEDPTVLCIQNEECFTSDEIQNMNCMVSENIIVQYISIYKNL